MTTVPYSPAQDAKALPYTDEADAPAWFIRPEHPVDLDLIAELHREAFHGSAEAELVDAIRSSADFIGELSLVAATDDGSILGHILISRIRFARADGPQTDALALAPLAVLPSHAGRGIGSTLMREGLAIADARPEPFVVVLGAPTFYGRFGFVAAEEVGIRGRYDEAGAAFQVRPRAGAGDVEPGTVIYPPAFDSV